MLIINEEKVTPEESIFHLGPARLSFELPPRPLSHFITGPQHHKSQLWPGGRLQNLLSLWPGRPSPCSRLAGMDGLRDTLLGLEDGVGPSASFGSCIFFN